MSTDRVGIFSTRQNGEVEMDKVLRARRRKNLNGNDCHLEEDVKLSDNGQCEPIDFSMKTLSIKDNTNQDTAIPNYLHEIKDRKPLNKAKILTGNYHQPNVKRFLPSANVLSNGTKNSRVWNTDLNSIEQFSNFPIPCLPQHHSNSYLGRLQYEQQAFWYYKQNQLAQHIKRPYDDDDIDQFAMKNSLSSACGNAIKTPEENDPRQYTQARLFPELSTEFQSKLAIPNAFNLMGSSHIHPSYGIFPSHMPYLPGHFPSNNKPMTAISPDFTFHPKSELSVDETSHHQILPAVTNFATQPRASPTFLTNTVHDNQDSNASINSDLSSGATTPTPIAAESGTGGGRKRGRPVPPELQDDKYRAKRVKNNEAAKRSRDLKRAREEAIRRRTIELQHNNEQLKQQRIFLEHKLQHLQSLIAQQMQA
ncbi:hypothetical protein CHUAL_012276 [Chamberlinius hualienensis]